MAEPIYSPGLEGVVAGETAISTIAGGLQYRGYTIEDLAEHTTFEEVAYLLIYDDLPNAEELQAFSKRLGEYAEIPTEILHLLKRIPANASPMSIMASASSLLAHWDEDAEDNSTEANRRKAERLLAKLPVAMAARHRFQQGKEPVAADPTRSLADNLLWMLFRSEPTQDSVKAMDVSLILYAEHEFNASTFTARVICSTLSDMHSSIAGAIGALKGPLHGGANERVMEVLEEVGSPANAEEWIRNALAEKRRIMGFGHRVYKDGDPRAVYLKTLCSKLAVETGNEAMESMADTIETIVRDEKGLPPNLDWPSARLYYYMGLPVSLYTPLFVISRVTGWSAHVIEQLANNRLIRPRANYTGPEQRAWKPIGER